MASIRRHARSPFWYIRAKDPDTGKWTERSTGLRRDSPHDTRKARNLAAKASADEAAISSTSGGQAALARWVPAFIESHCATRSQGYRRRLVIAWKAIRLFLSEQKIVFPWHIRYEHASLYLAWRQKRAVHGQKVCHNTALLELKFLSHLVNEAVRRGYCAANPIARLGIGRMPPSRHKRELTDPEIDALLKASLSEPAWLRRALRIALYTGCRFSECQIAISDVDLTKRTITIRDAKRSEADPRKRFTIPMPEELRPVFEEMIANGETITAALTRSHNAKMNNFFRRCGIETSFHSLRVTFVTRCHRSGLSMAEAMRLVNHSSELVHRIYSRLDVEDARRARAKVRLPSLAQETRAPRLRRSSVPRTDIPAA